MHLSTVETVLEYEVRSPAHFCFNVEAAHWPGQDIVSEHLALSCDVVPRRFTDERSGNRFLRFDAQPGPLAVRYKAEVEVHPAPPATELRETPVGEVPDDVFREHGAVSAVTAALYDATDVAISHRQFEETNKKLHEAMTELEESVDVGATPPGGLVIYDGPLRGREGYGHPAVVVHPRESAACATATAKSGSSDGCFVPPLCQARPYASASSCSRSASASW